MRIQSAHRGKAARKRTSEMHERRRQAQSQRRAVPAAQARPPPDASVHQKLAHKLEGRLERLETEEWVTEQEVEEMAIHVAFLGWLLLPLTSFRSFESLHDIQLYPQGAK